MNRLRERSNNKLGQSYPNLLEPELLAGPRIGSLLFNPGNEKLVCGLNSQAEQLKESRHNILQREALVIIQGREVPDSKGRVRNVAPKQQVEKLLATARNIRAQEYSGSVAIAATVDHSAYRPGREQGNELRELGVEIMRFESGVNLPKAFNEAYGQLAGTKDGSYDLVASITAGNRFVTNQALRAGALRMQTFSHAAFGPLLLGSKHPSNTARDALGADSLYYYQYAEPSDDINPYAPGFMNDAAVILHGQHLRTTKLDERYGRGGAFREWATRSIPTEIDKVWYDPLLAVHDARSDYLSRRDLEEEELLLGPTEFRLGA